MTEIKEAFSQKLHDEAMSIIEVREISHYKLADILDIFPEGAQRLLNQNNWPASTGFRILEALGASVDVTIHPDQL